MSVHTARTRPGPRRSGRLVVACALALTLLAGVLTASPAGAALPTGTLTAPVADTSFGPGDVVELSVEASDTPGTGGEVAGVRVVEWWLYADATAGAPTDFSTRFPNNGEDKVLIGRSTTPAAGTAAAGTWTTTWSVPSGGVIEVATDGDHTTPIADGATRTYDLPSGTYEIQGHLLDDEWFAAPGAPGFTEKVGVELRTGAAPDPDPSPSPDPVPSPSPDPDPDADANLVSNGDLELGGTTPTCFTGYGWGEHDASWSVTADARSGTRAQQVTVDGHTSGDRKLMMTAGADCAPEVQPGATYDLSVWYRSTTTASLTLFRHSDAGWTYWTDVTRLPAADGWTEATATTPEVPEGTDMVTWGVSIGADGTLVTDDYAMTPTAGAEPAPEPADGELVVNGDLEAGATAPTCFTLAGWGDRDVTAGTTQDGRTGRGFQIAMSDRVSGDAKLLTAEAAGCAPAVQPGEIYDLSVWYTSTTDAVSITVFRHTAEGWRYWTDLKGLPAADGWTKATAVLPEIPAGTDRVAWGLSLHGDGVLRTDDHSMTRRVTEQVTGGLAEIGRWTVLESPLPIRAIHSTLLRDGRLLLIAGSGNDPALFEAGSLEAVLWDPGTGGFERLPTPHDMFCAGHVTLPDGRVLIAGGTTAYPGEGDGPTTFAGSDRSYIFDPATNAFEATNTMSSGHWYPTLTKLETGDVWAAGGLGGDTIGTVATELFDVDEERWLGLGEVPQTWSFWGTYPHMFLMADGRLFYSGGHTFGNGLPGTGSSIYDWRTAEIVDIAGLRDKDLRDQAGSVILPPAQDQRVMIVGGGNTDANARAVNTVDIVDLTAPVPAYEPGPDLPGPGKSYVNTVVLPDRTVLAANGAQYNRAENVRTAAIYDPVANAWTSVAADPIGRNYHSSASLLPDGRVVVFGSNPLDNSFELRISVYEPPYLFAGDRPEITASPVRATHGETIELGVTGEVVSASLLAPMSATHQTDTNARLVDLPIAGSGDARTAAVPDNPAVLPPGPYMLTVLDADGVPSVAQWLIVE